MILSLLNIILHYLIILAIGTLAVNLFSKFLNYKYTIIFFKNSIGIVSITSLLLILHFFTYSNGSNGNYALFSVNPEVIISTESNHADSILANNSPYRNLKKLSQIDFYVE